MSKIPQSLQKPVSIDSTTGASDVIGPVREDPAVVPDEALPRPMQAVLASDSFAYGPRPLVEKVAVTGPNMPDSGFLVSQKQDSGAYQYALYDNHGQLLAEYPDAYNGEYPTLQTQGLDPEQGVSQVSVNGDRVVPPLEANLSKLADAMGPAFAANMDAMMRKLGTDTMFANQRDTGFLAQAMDLILANGQGLTPSQRQAVTNFRDYCDGPGGASNWTDRHQAPLPMLLAAASFPELGLP